MTYKEVVNKAKREVKSRTAYGNSSITYKNCQEWLDGDQINLWSYWQGYQLQDIDRGIDILLVGQDWGNPDTNLKAINTIKDIQAGKDIEYYANSATDRTLTELFQCLGCDIATKDPGKRILFTNYSLGYRAGSETGGMTKTLMRQDEELFHDIVGAVKPIIIICLGKITFEVVAGRTVSGFIKQLRVGKPFKALFPETSIPVYGVAHPGARGISNIGGKEKMITAWGYIAKETNRLF